MKTFNHGFDNFKTSPLNIDALEKMRKKLKEQRRINKLILLLAGIWNNWRNN